jgi:hypothetical protein
MVFMPGKALQAGILGILLSFAVLIVCIAGFSEQNATDFASGDGIVTSSKCGRLIRICCLLNVNLVWTVC